jgi:uncharacterized protein (TIGR03437 family)
MRFLSAAFCGLLAFAPRVGEAIVYTPPPFVLGNFGPLEEFPLHAHDGFVTADFNGDGREDVFAWENASHRMVLYHADAAGNLSPVQVIESPSDEYFFSTFIRFHGKVADGNGDGLPDVFLLEEGTARFVFLAANARGRMEPPRFWKNPSYSYALDWRPVDVNRDGLADLVFSEEQDRFVVAIQREGFQFDPVWWPASVLSPGFEGWPVAVGALDGKSLPDLTWTVRNAAGARRTLVFVNQGETRFLPGIPLRLNARTGPILWGDLIPDLTGDGIPELLQRDPDKQQLTIFQGTGTEVFRPWQTLAAPVFGETLWSDLDGDGALDWIEEDSARACHFLNDGKGKLRAPACENYNHLPGERRRVARADLNGDQLLDRVLLVAPGEGEPAYLRRSLGNRMLLRLAPPALPQNPVAGQTWNFQADLVAASPSFLPPRGHLRLLRDGNELARLPIVPVDPPSAAALRPIGRASGAVVLPAGQYQLSYDYAGDRNYAPGLSEASSLLLAPQATSTTLTLSSAALREGQELRFTAQVRAAEARAGTPAGSVSIRRDGQEIASLPLAAGQASWASKTLVPGQADYVAEYVPSENFFASNSPPRAATITGELKLRNAFSLREAAAPASIVQLEATGAIGAGPWTLEIGTLRVPATLAAPSRLELVLPANTPLGIQNLALTREKTRWDGRITVTRTAPGITAVGGYWSLLQGGVARRSSALDADQNFPLTNWLSEAGSTVTLTLLGTGWRQAAAAGQIVAKFNATPLAVLAYGAHESIPGLDFVTVQIPSAFRPPAGNTLTPRTRLQITAGGIVSNALDLLLR